MIKNESQLALAGLLLLLPVLAAAQNTAPQTPSTPASAASSSESRQDALKALNDKQRAALDAIRADGTLTPDQRRDKISATLKDFRTQREALLGIKPGQEGGASADSNDPRRKALRDINDKQKAALDAIRADAALTPDQRRDKISAVLKDFRAQRESLLGIKPGGSGASAAAANDPRRAAMRALNEKQRAAIDAIRADGTLTPDQRRDKISAALKDFRAQRETLIKSDSMQAPPSNAK